MKMKFVLRATMLSVVSCFSCFVGVILTSLQAEAGNLSLPVILTEELNLVLKASSELHHSLWSRNEEQIEMGLRDLLLQLDRVHRLAFVAKEHERRHLVRILETALEQFELTQSAFGEQRRQHLEEGFNQLVNLLRIYRLDRSYGIFFCARDRTTWVQKGWKARHPFRPDTMKDCGMRVSN